MRLNALVAAAIFVWAKPYKELRYTARRASANRIFSSVGMGVYLKLADSIKASICSGVEVAKRNANNWHSCVKNQRLAGGSRGRTWWNTHRNNNTIKRTERKKYECTIPVAVHPTPLAHLKGGVHKKNKTLTLIPPFGNRPILKCSGRRSLSWG